MMGEKIYKMFGLLYVAGVLFHECESKGTKEGNFIKVFIKIYGFLWLFGNAQLNNLFLCQIFRLLCSVKDCDPSLFSLEQMKEVRYHDR